METARMHQQHTIWKPYLIICQPDDEPSRQFGLANLITEQRTPVFLEGVERTVDERPVFDPFQEDIG